MILKSQQNRIELVTRPVLHQGINYAVQDLDPLEFALDDGRKISLWIAECRIEKPSVPAGTVGVTDNRVYPSGLDIGKSFFQIFLV